jgi:hypothetical protein
MIYEKEMVTPGGAKMHLHLMGRAKEQTHQIRGQHIFLFPKGHKTYQGHLNPLSDEQVGALRRRIAEKYERWPN